MRRMIHKHSIKHKDHDHNRDWDWDCEKERIVVKDDRSNARSINSLRFDAALSSFRYHPSGSLAPVLILSYLTEFHLYHKLP